MATFIFVVVILFYWFSVKFENSINCLALDYLLLWGKKKIKTPWNNLKKLFCNSKIHFYITSFSYIPSLFSFTHLFENSLTTLTQFLLRFLLAFVTSVRSRFLGSCRKVCLYVYKNSWKEHEESFICPPTSFR